MRLAGTCVLVLSVFALAGPAYAGNGNGNGNGIGNGGASDAAPGNSASAPGQLKKDAPPAAASETTTTATTATTTTAAEPSAPASVGVKPSNETAHDTLAEAQSDKTKQYGNGQTAGQVAVRNGAAGTDVLHGPGNSQPHKLSPCSGGHEVDAHALKSHRADKCGSGDPHPGPAPSPGPSSTPSPAPTASPNTGAPAPSATTNATALPAGETPPTGFAPGAKPHATPAEGDVSSSAGGDANAVLAATQRLGRVATLPFTGQRLWLAVLAGLILIAVGLGLREIRPVESPVQSGRDHTDRARQSARGSRPPIRGRRGR
jgi:hypothetical protein